MPRRQSSTSSTESAGGNRSSIRRKGSQKRTRPRANAVVEGDRRLTRRLSEKQSKWVGAQKTLREILKQSGNLRRFREFLENEFSQENLDFWLAVEDYKKMPEGEDRTQKATHIYERYVKCNAPEQVNLTHSTRLGVVERMRQIDSDTFSAAQKEIYKLIEHDSYRRFSENLVI